MCSMSDAPATTVDGEPPSGSAQMRTVFERVIAVTLDAVSVAGEAVEASVQADLGDAAASEVRLGIVEAMVNVVKHGHAEVCADAQMVLRCEAGPQHWCFTLTDHGKPIPADKLSAADGSVFDFDPLDIDSVPDGGMGLSLIHMVFDQVDYRSSNGCNELVLTKYPGGRP
jgi:serine/threonine-protein kinase RsbW